MATVSVVLHHNGRGPLVHPRVDAPPITFPPGVPVDVDEDVAGEEPGPWVPFLDDEGNPILTVPDDGRAYRWAETGGHLEVRTLGWGLLAHVDDFRRATPADFGQPPASSSTSNGAGAGGADEITEG